MLSKGQLVRFYDAPSPLNLRTNLYVWPKAFRSSGIVGVVLEVKANPSSVFGIGYEICKVYWSDKKIRNHFRHELELFSEKT